MRKSIGAAMAALVVAGTAFMACGDTSEEWEREQILQHGRAHAVMNCVQTEMLLRGRQGLEVTGEDRWKIERECKVRIGR